MRGSYAQDRGNPAWTNKETEEAVTFMRAPFFSEVNCSVTSLCISAYLTPSSTPRSKISVVWSFRRWKKVLSFKLLGCIWMKLNEPAGTCLLHTDRFSIKLWAKWANRVLESSTNPSNRFSSFTQSRSGGKAVTYMMQKVAVLHNYGVQISSACMPKCHVCMKFEGLQPHGVVLVKVHK